LAPNRSDAQPASGIETASASRYALATQWTWVIETPKSRARSCRATLTTVVSTIDMTEPSTTVPATNQVARSIGSAAMAAR
jgi:hypothetical protein